MTEMSVRPITPELRTWLNTWKSSTQQVLSQVAGKPIELDLSAEPLPAVEAPAAAGPAEAPPAPDAWYTVAASGAVRGEMALRIPSAAGATMAQLLIGAADPSSSVLTAELKEGLEKLLRQIAGQAATVLKAALGSDVQLQVSPSSPPSWPAADVVWIGTPSGAEKALAFELQISAALAASLQSRPSPASDAARPAPPALSASYDRLMDVGLEVKLRFGSRRMVLRDVLALSAGAVVELDRKLHAPADLLLDGRVIAQGEVVVVEGKYGLRVTEVFDPRPSS